MKRRFGKAITLALAAPLAASLACELAPAAGASDVGSDPTQSEVPGFRSDAWYLPDDDMLGFVDVPAGPFLMGSSRAADSLAFDNELWEGGGAPRTVDVPAFLIGRYEVTVAQYRAFVEASGHSGDPAALQGPPDHPVTAVNWTDALAYCRWLQKALSESETTPASIKQMLAEGARLSLPSEAEWEKAARGVDGRVYPWGNEPRLDRANFQGTGTTPVGSRPCPECPYGLSDMSGNVFEWTRTPYRAEPYGGKPADVDLAADALWVMRGGSFADPPRNVRAALRGGGDPSVRRPFIGFRVVISRF
jgi:formylglycine-generating enzyme required for sulfatase activity